MPKEKRGRDKAGLKDSEEKRARKAQALGAWNPKALIVKGAQQEENCSLVLFYQYVEPLWSESRRQEAMDTVTKLGGKLNLGGRVRIAREGFNATVSGTFDAVREFAKELGNFDKHFLETDFKYIDDLHPDKAFKDLKVFSVAELVFYGFSSEEALTMGEGGEHLDPAQYHAMMKRPDAVIIDVRNHYEAAIGRFQKQESEGGAKWIDPKMRKSTDFRAWLSKEETKQELAGKEVLMYCTGGVRCERASILVKNQLGDDVKGVYQLQGGIEKYLKQFPDGGFWAGKNKVFDKREAFGVGDPNGVGGVIKVDKKKKKKKGAQTDEDDEVLGRCCVCDAPWERYIGKKKCYSCGVMVLMCEDCCMAKPDKGSEEEKLSVRCPLCKEEGRTEPASEAEFRENGISAESEGGRAVGTVLKWGGGYSKKKKEEGGKRKEEGAGKRKEERGGEGKRETAKFADRPCKFGAQCKRPDCWFKH